MSEKTTLTYTAMRTFLNCQKKYQFRFRLCLVRIGYAVGPLLFGQAIHEGVHKWNTTGDRLSVFDVPVGEEFSLLYAVTMTAYTDWYRDDPEVVIASEEIFEVPIRNPWSNRSSHSFTFRGRIDARIANWIIETKTTSRMNESYLEQLWSDRQIMLYTSALRTLGHRIDGVIYNIIEKPSIRQRKDESPDEFRDRLTEKYADGQMFHREYLYFSEDDLARVQMEVWQITQQILHCRRNDTWLQNPSNCFSWGRACQYYPICRSNENPVIIENQFELKPPHEELQDEQWSAENSIAE